MEKTYWLRRQHAAVAMARAATTAESRLIHYDLAGRYSLRAASPATGSAPARWPRDERRFAGTAADRCSAATRARARAAPSAPPRPRSAMSRRSAPSSTAIMTALDGRPIDLAVASDDGLARVEAAIAAAARPAQ